LLSSWQVLDVDGGFKVAMALPGHTQDAGEATGAEGEDA